MTLLNYVLCFASAILGMGIYLFVVKIPSTLEHARVANHPMTLLQYFKTDIVAITGSLLSILFFLVCADEFIEMYPPIKPILKIVYGAIGFMGSTLAIAALGKASKLINNIVDIKTDIADGKRANDNPTV